MKNNEKFKAAVSDTDILIDLYKCDAYGILTLLFDKILIPEFIFEKELKRVATRDKNVSFFKMEKYFKDKDSPFEIVYDKDVDFLTRKTKKAIKEQCENIAGPGEVECVCYARASGVNFVVSNNHTEFKYLNDIAIMLSCSHIISICVMHKKITHKEGERLYNLVNKIKTKPSSHTFSIKLKNSLKYFEKNNYLEILNLSQNTK